MAVQSISVRDLVTFLYGTGDLESQTKGKKNRLIGQTLHLERQNTYQADDQSEVTVNSSFEDKDFTLHLRGRMDGLLMREDAWIIEEIKSTHTSLKLMKEDTFPSHMMQARFYAYMYMLEHDLKAMTVWLTYIHYPTKAIKTFKTHATFESVKTDVMKAVKAYKKWLIIYETHQFEKEKSLIGLTFPHEGYREGQYHFMGAVYKTLMSEDIMYATAPTGIGKTIGALFSGLKTLKDDKEKLFFLTAKNAGKTIAVKTMEDLKAHGLKIKAITLNSKENMCLRDEVDCDPDICPYARSYYDRLRGALEDIFVHDDVYDQDLIMKYGEYHKICPHAFALDISNYADVIICDFNYVFDPRIKLIRYFEDTAYKPKLLVDEAHNLIDRTRAMYSASLAMSKIDTMMHSLKGIKPSPLGKVFNLKREMERLIETYEIKKTGLYIDTFISEPLLGALSSLVMTLADLLETHKKHKKRKAIREAYYEVLEFSRISEYFTSAFRFTIEEDTESNDITFNIVCLDASVPVSEIVRTYSKGSVFFSATLKPFEYFANLITKGEGKPFEVPSPFDPDNLGLMVDISTSTRYHDRPMSTGRILDTLYAMLESKQGNYIVFFPSYKYMNMVLELFDKDVYHVMVQTRGMSLRERRDFLKRFKAPTTKSKILFSVLGGSFSEGIDYVGDMLSGVLVVGVAFPALSTMNKLLRDYYTSVGLNGFDYAYTYPGMNKVIQAVGRVIRRQEDRGIAVLLDSRYAMTKYKRLMPTHWRPIIIEEEHFIQTFIKNFWNTSNN